MFSVKIITAYPEMFPGVLGYSIIGKALKEKKWVLETVNLHDFGCTLKAYKKEIAKGLNLYGEMHRFIPVFAGWKGAKITEIEVNHHPRIPNPNIC